MIPGLCVEEAIFLSAADQQKVFAGCTAAGAQYVRIGVPWSVINPVRGTYNWGILDAAITTAHDNHLKVLLNVIPPKPSFGFWIFGGTSRSDLATFCAALCTRYYPQGVADYEIWNEMNSAASWSTGGLLWLPGSVNVANYVSWLQPTYKAMHQAVPGVNVISGGLEACASWLNELQDPVTALSSMYKAGLKGNCDAVAYHPYSLSSGFTYEPPTATQQFVADLTALHDIMVANGDGDKIIWATEWGFPTIIGSTRNSAGSIQATITGDQQAQYLTEQWQVMSTLDFIGPALIYQYRDYSLPNQTYSHADPDQNHGLVTSNYAPKPALSAVTALFTPKPAA
jgi:hypothetical protein